jgi:hypothetical protein
MKKLSLFFLLCLLAVLSYGTDGAQVNKIIAQQDADNAQLIPANIRKELDSAIATSDAAIDDVQYIQGEARNKLKATFPVSGGPSSPFLTSLVGYWKLDEASGTRSDSVGASHLTDNNTVTSATGKVGDAGQFVKVNQESLSVTDNAALSVGGTDFSIQCWFNPVTAVAGAPLVAKYTADGLQRGYTLRVSAGVLNFAHGADSLNYDDVSGATALSAGNWYHAVVTWKESTKAAIIYLNGNVDGGYTSLYATYDDASDFVIGTWSERLAIEALYQNALIDEVGLWKRVLTPAEVTTLYNSGGGLTYPTFAYNWRTRNIDIQMVKYVPEHSGIKSKHYNEQTKSFILVN